MIFRLKGLKAERLLFWGRLSAAFACWQAVVADGWNVFFIFKRFSPSVGSMDAVLDKLYGKVGTPEREEFRKEAYSYCVGQLISDARKQERLTQAELAEKVGTNKSYISRIEKGAIEPGVGLFFRIIDALGLKMEIVKPMI